MKRKRIVTLLVIATMLLSTLVLAMPAIASTPSNWAVGEMDEANLNMLLTPSAQRDFRRHLTREEYCELVVVLVERLRGSPLPLPANNKFTDTNSIHVLKAEAYGIVNGTTDTTFSPYSTVQRQQICAMMIRAINGLEREMNRTLLEPAATSLPFTDTDEIAEYAIMPARFAYSNGIMEGNANNTLTPRNSITSEECVAIIIRSFKRIDGILAQRRTTANHLDVTEDRLGIGFAFGDNEYGVTRNIQLPTRGSGGAVISWSSSDTGIISIGGIIYNNAETEVGRIGVVRVGNNARNVTLTATITLNNVTRTVEYTIRTSLLSGDQLLMENAYNALDIIYYNEGDGPGNVTGRIGLVDKIMDLPVTWRTSNANVVTTAGFVNVPNNNEIRNATLTATIGNGSATRTKTFDLTIINPSYNRGARLHGIELGTSSSRVTQVLGTVRKTIQTSNAETWQLYHNNYEGFIAVAFVGNRAVAVYSMASNVANQLRNDAGTVITIDAANVVSNVTAVSFNDVSSQYAIMLYESNSDIGTRRTLSTDGQEELLFELVNAYRIRNGRAALEWSDRLRNSSRTHSEWLRGNAPSNGTGSNSLSNRAENAGFYTSGNRPRYGGGNAMGGENDAFGFLSQIVTESNWRNDILSRDNTLFGAGYATTNSGSYRTYMTYMLGQVRFITAVTASPVTGNPATIQVPGIGVGSTQTVTLNLTYTSLVSGNAYNEPYTVTSSNTNRMTVADGSGANSYILTGVSVGAVNLVVTGTLSGKSYTLPVNVAAGGIATSLQITYPAAPAPITIAATPLIATNQISASRTSTYTLIVGENESLTLSATATAATNSTAPVVTWRIDNSETVVTGNSYTMSGRSAGNYVIKATVPTSSGSIEHTINVRVVAVNLSQRTIELNLGSQAPPTTITPVAANAPPVGPSSYIWSPTSGTVAWVDAASSTTQNAVITAAGTITGSEATATIQGAMIWNVGHYNPNTHYLGYARANVSVTVKNAIVHILPPNTTFYPGETQNLSTSFTNTTGHTIDWRVISGNSIEISAGYDKSWSCQIEAVDVGATRIAVEVRDSGGELVGQHEMVITTTWPTLNINAPNELSENQEAVFSWANTELAAMGYSVEWKCSSTESPGAEFDTGSNVETGNSVKVVGLVEDDVVTITADLLFENVSIPDVSKWVSSPYIVGPETP
ncbi:MAG: S-layer homology domain-containing protein [Oscillospiraceae bacterium]|nr:S-layer homology domain-containing protein [Oscillospiraceae bacterium]